MPCAFPLQSVLAASLSPLAAGAPLRFDGTPLPFSYEARDGNEGEVKRKDET